MSIPDSGTINSAYLYQLTTPAGANSGALIDTTVSGLGLGGTAFVAGSIATASNATFSTTTVNGVSTTSLNFANGTSLTGLQIINQGAGGFTFSDSTGATYYFSKSAITGTAQINVNSNLSTALVKTTLDTLVSPNPTIWVNASNTPSGLDGSAFIACFLAGTMIETLDGEVAVQDLRIGDLVLNAAREPKRVVWIGRRSYAASFVRGNARVEPIRLAAGCLADGVPSRDLYLSPSHALLIDGVLIPAEHLVTEGAVERGFTQDVISYVHIELDDHDAIWANGVTAETYIDDANRSMFENAAEYYQHNQTIVTDAAVYCAPRVVDGDALQAVRDRIALRAARSRALAA